VINELAQWAVLCFLAVFVLGLTRQLGNFLVPKQDQLAMDVGPRVGQALPSQLLSGEQRHMLAELISASPGGFGAIVVIDEDCLGCKALLERLERSPSPEGAPVAVFSHKSSAEHEARLRDKSDLVVVDPARLKALDLETAPFVMLVDSELALLHKEVAPDIEFVIRRWREEQRLDAPRIDSGTNGHPSLITVESRGGHREDGIA
jgi:hypothetical protein